MNKNPLIALLTDFGLSDAYVGTMKGVILRICPAARLVDLTHDIQPQNIRQAAYVLLTSYAYFPPETVFLVVVDPGVGTARAPVVVETDHGTYVAPDNGVLSYVLSQVTVLRSVLLHNPEYRLADVSSTFHGRDIFAPAAAHLAAGVPARQFGPPADELVTLPEPRLDIDLPRITGEVQHIDHFGNIITSIGWLSWSGPDTLALSPQFGSPDSGLTDINAASCTVSLKQKAVLGIRPTYGAVAPGAITALIGSAGQLEIGMNQGSAAAEFGARIGDPVTLIIENIGL
jgi:S-adenosylmethionine hydrolase